MSRSKVCGRSFGRANESKPDSKRVPRRLRRVCGIRSFRQRRCCRPPCKRRSEERGRAAASDRSRRSSCATPECSSARCPARPSARDTAWSRTIAEPCCPIRRARGTAGRTPAYVRTNRDWCRDGDDGLLVILDAADGSVRRAAPQVRLENLAAAIAVRAQVGIDCIEEAGEERLRVGHIAIEVERAIVPIWVVVNHVLEELIGGAEDVGPGGMPAPPALAAAHKPGIELCSRSRVAWPRVDICQRRHLGRCEAGVRILPRRA